LSIPVLPYYLHGSWIENGYLIAMFLILWCRYSVFVFEFRLPCTRYSGGPTQRRHWLRAFCTKPAASNRHLSYEAGNHKTTRCQRRYVRGLIRMFCILLMMSECYYLYLLRYQCNICSAIIEQNVNNTS